MSFRLLVLCLIGVILLVPATWAEDSGQVPYFTDEDLLKYKEHSSSSFDTDNTSTPDKDTYTQDIEDNKKPNTSRTYRVKYTPFEGLTKRIIVSATFNDTFVAPAAIDTGAGGVLISLRLAEKLGIMSYDEGKVLWQASGIGGSTKAFITILDSVSIGGAREEFVPVFIIESLSEHFDALIGMDFLSNYSVYIDTSSNYLVLTEIPDKKRFPAGHDRHWWISNFKRFKYYKEYWYKIYQLLKDNQKIPADLKSKLKKQYEEAEKLFYRLNSYAIDNNVPLSWRIY